MCIYFGHIVACLSIVFILLWDLALPLASLYPSLYFFFVFCGTGPLMHLSSFSSSPCFVLTFYPSTTEWDPYSFLLSSVQLSVTLTFMNVYDRSWSPSSPLFPSCNPSMSNKKQFWPIFISQSASHLKHLSSYSHYHFFHHTSPLPFFLLTITPFFHYSFLLCVLSLCSSPA